MIYHRRNNLVISNVGYVNLRYFYLPTIFFFLSFSFKIFNSFLTLSYPGRGAKYAPLLFFLHHPETAQGIKLKLSDFKDTPLRHILQVKPVR